MKTITVFARDAVRFNGVSYPKGAPIVMSAVDALIEKRKRRISLKALSAAESEPVPSPSRDTQELSEFPKRRTYRRRDMRAEETQAMTAETEAPTVATWSEPDGLIGVDLAKPTDEDR